MSLPKEGTTLSWRECHLLLGIGDVPGRYMYTAGTGDAPPNTRKGFAYHGVRFPQFGVALHLYREKDIDADKAMILAFKMAKKGKI